MAFDLADLPELSLDSVTEHLCRAHEELQFYHQIGTSTLVYVHSGQPLPPDTTADDPVSFRHSSDRSCEDEEYDIQFTEFCGAIQRNAVGIRQDHTIMILGWAGSGKTSVAGRLAYNLSGGGGRGGGGGGIDSVAQRSRDAHFVLHALGAAAVGRNSNSSRFTHAQELIFRQSTSRGGGRSSSRSKSTGSVDALDLVCTGVQQHVYMLETSRVTTFTAEDKPGNNFHALYLLLGLPEAQRQDLGLDLELDECEDYRLLSGTTAVAERANLEKEAADLLAALKRLGLTSGDGESSVADNLWAGLAAVLFLGDLEFSGPLHRPILVDDAPLKSVGRLLGIMGGEVSLRVALTSIDRAASEIARDNLCQRLYGAVVRYAMDAINEQDMKAQEAVCGIIDKEAESVKVTLIDVFGLDEGGGEAGGGGGDAGTTSAVSAFTDGVSRLCRNLIFEQSRVWITTHMCQVPQVEHEFELIDWEHVDFPLDRTVVELILGRPNGLFPLVATSWLKGDSDAVLAANFAEKDAAAPCPIFKTPTPGAVYDFSIMHCGCEVRYSLDGFLSANDRTLEAAVVTALEGATNPVVGALLDAITGNIGRRDPQAADTETNAARCTLRTMHDLIDGSAMDVVRCIATSRSGLGEEWDDGFVRTQLDSTAAVPAMQVSAATYPMRFSFPDFLTRFGSRKKQQKMSATAAACTAILRSKKVSSNLYAVGTSCVFLRWEAISLLKPGATTLARRIDTSQSIEHEVDPVLLLLGAGSYEIDEVKSKATTTATATQVPVTSSKSDASTAAPASTVELVPRTLPRPTIRQPPPSLGKGFVARQTKRLPTAPLPRPPSSELSMDAEYAPVGDEPLAGDPQLMAGAVDGAAASRALQARSMALRLEDGLAGVELHAAMDEAISAANTAVARASELHRIIVSSGKRDTIDASLQSKRNRELYELDYRCKDLFTELEQSRQHDANERSPKRALKRSDFYTYLPIVMSVFKDVWTPNRIVTRRPTLAHQKSVGDDGPTAALASNAVAAAEASRKLSLAQSPKEMTKSKQSIGTLSEALDLHKLATRSSDGRKMSLSTTVIEKHLRTALDGTTQKAVKSETLLEQPWFHGDLSREECEARLAGTADGTFLVRVSKARGGVSLSLNSTGGLIRHYLINKKVGAGFYIVGKARGFKTMTDLVDFYRLHAVRSVGTKLIFPCPRPPETPEQASNRETLYVDLISGTINMQVMEEVAGLNKEHALELLGAEKDTIIESEISAIATATGGTDTVAGGSSNASKSARGYEHWDMPLSPKADGTFEQDVADHVEGETATAAAVEAAATATTVATLSSAEDAASGGRLPSPNKPQPAVSIGPPLPLRSDSPKAERRASRLQTDIKRVEQQLHIEKRLIDGAQTLLAMPGDKKQKKSRRDSLEEAMENYARLQAEMRSLKMVIETLGESEEEC